jgi:hypothetical protein
MTKNLFTTELSSVKQSDDRLMKAHITPIMAQAPIKTITTIQPVSSYKSFETLVVPPLVISPNVTSPIVSTVFQERSSPYSQSFR